MDYWIKIVFLFNLVICLQALKIPDCLNTEDADTCYVQIFQESSQEMLKKIERLNELQMKNEETIIDLRKENQHMSDELNNLKNENRNLQSTINNMVDEMKDIKVVADASMNATEEIRQENKLIYETQDNLTTLYKNLLHLLQSFASSKAETDASVSTRVGDLEAKHSDLLSNLAQSREVNKNISDIVSTLKEKNTELSSSIDDMKDHFHQLQSDLDDKHKDLLNSTNNIRSSMDDLEALKQEHMEKIQNLTTDLSKVFPCGFDIRQWEYEKKSGNCYLVLKDILNWREARDKCRSLAGTGETSDLASIHSYEENNFILGLLLEDYWTWRSPWIGLHDTEEEGSFHTWSDGSQVEFTDWNTNEPNQKGNEDCVIINRYQKWNDIGCDHLAPAVCKKMIL